MGLNPVERCHRVLYGHVCMRLEVKGASAWAPRHSQDCAHPAMVDSTEVRHNPALIYTHFVLETAAAVCKIGLLYGQNRRHLKAVSKMVYHTSLVSCVRLKLAFYAQSARFQ